MSQQPRASPQNIMEQLKQLVGKYKYEAEQARLLGPDTTEGAAHQQRADSIRGVLQHYQSQNAHANRQASGGPLVNAGQALGVPGDNRQVRMPQLQGGQPVGPGGMQQMRQMPGGAQGAAQGGPQGAQPGGAQGAAARAANQMPQFENPAVSQQQMTQQQMRTQQGQHNAVAGMQTLAAVQQRQQAVTELRKQQIELGRRAEQLESMIRNGAPPEEAQRMHQSLQAIQRRREQYRQREAQILQELKLTMRQNPNLLRQAAAQQQQQQQQQAGQPPAQGQPPTQRQPQPQQTPQQQHQQLAQGMNIPANPQAGMMPPNQAAMPSQPSGPQSAGPQGPAGVPNQRMSQNTAAMRQQMTGTPQPGAAGAQGPAAAAGTAAAAPAPGAAPGAAAAPGAPGSGPGSDVSGPVTRRMAAMSGSGGRQNSLVVPATLNVAQPVPVNVRPGRPTLLNGGASSSIALNSPALTRIPGFEVTGDRVLSKRKLSELVSGVLGEDNSAAIDGDVEELLYDLADEFITSVTSFACKIAKHRHSDVLEAKDIQLHLERHWNMRIPGFSSDEVRSVRKIQPVSSYQQKLNAISVNRGAQK